MLGYDITRQRSFGRLLNEFLVSLGLLFLSMTASFAILNSATRSSEEAAVRERALSLARSGMEKIIGDYAMSGSNHLRQGFGAGVGSRFRTRYQRDIWKTALKGESTGLYRVVVQVEWGDNQQRVRLERYVR